MYSSSQKLCRTATGNSHAIWKSHSVTCHPTEVRILPPVKAGTRFSDPGGMQGWVNLCYVEADRYLSVASPTQLPLSHHATHAMFHCIASQIIQNAPFESEIILIYGDVLSVDVMGDAMVPADYICDDDDASWKGGTIFRHKRVRSLSPGKGIGLDLGTENVSSIRILQINGFSLSAPLVSSSTSFWYQFFHFWLTHFFIHHFFPIWFTTLYIYNSLFHSRLKTYLFHKSYTP